MDPIYLTVQMIKMNLKKSGPNWSRNGQQFLVIVQYFDTNFREFIGNKLASQIKPTGRI